MKMVNSKAIPYLVAYSCGPAQVLAAPALVTCGIFAAVTFVKMHHYLNKVNTTSDAGHPHRAWNDKVDDNRRMLVESVSLAAFFGLSIIPVGGGYLGAMALSKISGPW